MTDTIVFAVELLVSLMLSIAVLWRLQEQLRDVGRSLCERGGTGADFWIAYFQLMVLMAPLMVVAFFSRAGAGYSSVRQLQSSIFIVLVAQLVGLALLGRAVWRAANPPKIVNPAPAARHPTAEPASRSLPVGL